MRPRPSRSTEKAKRVSIVRDALNPPAEPAGIIQGDNLEVLRKWPSNIVDLIYIDPPFNTGIRRRLQSIRLHTGEKTRTGFGGKTYSYEVRSDLSYDDDMPFEEYLAFLGDRIREGYRVLKETGSFFLHIDPRIVHHVRMLMDEIFGSHHFVNEIIWAYDYGGRPRDRFPPKHDNILWYAKSGHWVFNREDVDRIPYMAPGLVGPEKAAHGKLPTDVWWMTIVPTNGKERTGYPTQKPEKILERIIRAASSPGDFVVDFFAGSGTAGAVADRLGRRWALVDSNPEAIRIIRERLKTTQPALFAAALERRAEKE